MDIYGLGTCDTCRAARKALGEVARFRDVRAVPLSAEEIAEFLAAFGPDLVNRRSTTWRGLSETERREAPQALLARHPALMKRPVIRAGDELYLGWGPEVQTALATG